MANENMIRFYRGLVNNLPATGENGALYITTDEGAIYYGTGTGMKRLGDFIQVANVDALPEKAHESCLYYCVEENILAKWNGTEWIQINKQKTLAELGGVAQTAYNEKVAALEQADSDNATAISGVDERLKAAEDKLKSVATTEGLGELTDRVTTAEGEIDALQAASHTHSFVDTDVEDAIAKKHAHTFADADVVDAISKKHAHTFVESELNKIAAGDVAKWNGVVADHLVAADKTELVDSIGDVNTALENYKTSNNEALAGVKATAEAAATKEYADAELAKKVAKSDYEADKATFATKTELNGVDAKFANYKTAEAQKVIDDAQDVEIAKKVDKVDGKSLVDDAEITKLAGVSEGANKVEASTNGKIKIDGVDTTVYVHPEKHTVSEISDFDASVKAYGYATKTEAQAMADGKDEAIAAALKAGTDAQGEVDALEAYVGTFTASEGVDTVVKYIDAKTANIASDERVSGIENRVKAIEDDYLVEADKTELAGLVTAEKERAEGIEGGLRTDINTVMGDYLKAADKTELEGKITAEETRAKGVEESLQTQINTIMSNPDAEGAINSINEFTQYVKDHGTIADGFRADIDKNKEDIAANTKAIGDEAARADAAEKALAGRLDTLEAIDHDAYVAADTALKTELEGKITSGDEATLEAAKTDAANKDAVVLSEAQKYADAAKTAAIADAEGKVNALASNVYTKAQTYTQDEVNAAIEAAVTSATQWGEF